MSPPCLDRVFAALRAWGERSRRNGCLRVPKDSADGSGIVGSHHASALRAGKRSVKI